MRRAAAAWRGAEQPVRVALAVRRLFTRLPPRRASNSSSTLSVGAGIGFRRAVCYRLAQSRYALTGQPVTSVLPTS